MQLNFNLPLKNLDGTVIRENAGQVLAHDLVNTPKGDPIKHYDWALRLHKGETIELDKSDTAYLKKFISDSQTITILAKAQLLEVFEVQPDRTEKG